MKKFLILVAALACLVSCRQETDAPWDKQDSIMTEVQDTLSVEEMIQPAPEVCVEFRCGHSRAVFEKPKVTGLDNIQVDWGDESADSGSPMHDYGTLDGEENHVFSLKGEGEGRIILRRLDGIQSISIRRDSL